MFSELVVEPPAWFFPREGPVAVFALVALDDLLTGEGLPPGTFRTLLLEAATTIGFVPTVSGTFLAPGGHPGFLFKGAIGAPGSLSRCGAGRCPILKAAGTRSALSCISTISLSTWSSLGAKEALAPSRSAIGMRS